MTKHRGKMSSKTYTEAFKKEAVNFVRNSGIGTAQSAEDLGISRSTLDRWLKEQSTTPDEEPLTASEREELKKLRKEVNTLRMERDFLKKTAAFFVKNPL